MLQTAPAQMALFYQQTHLCGGFRDILAGAAPGYICGSRATTTDPGCVHTAEILSLGHSNRPSASPLPSKHMPCPTWARIIGNADSRWEGIKLRLRRLWSPRIETYSWQPAAEKHLDIGSPC